MGEFVKGGNTWLLLHKEEEGVGVLEGRSRKSMQGVLQIKLLRIYTFCNIGQQMSRKKCPT